MKHPTLPAAALLALALILPACPAPEAPVTSDSSLLETLGKLGVDTNLGGRTGADGAALDAAANPLGGKMAAPRRQPEAFLCPADAYPRAFDLDLAACKDVPLVPSGDYSGTYGIVKRPVAGDFDGNGRDEVVIAAFSTAANAISLYEVASTDTPIMTKRSTVAWQRAASYPAPQDTENDIDPRHNIARDWNHTIDLAAGDVDGDGKDELCVASEGKLYLFDDDLSPLGGGVPMASFPRLNAGYPQCLRVECARLDPDGRAEIVLANGSYAGYVTATLTVLRYAAGALHATGIADLPLAAGAAALRSAEIKVGDVDGDGPPEIVASGLRNDQGKLATVVIDVTAAAGTGALSAAIEAATWWEDDLNSRVHDFYSGWESARDQDAAVPVLALADFDGTDGKAEIVAGDDVLSANRLAGAWSVGPAYNSSSDELLRGGLAQEYLCGWGGIWGDRATDTAYFNQAAAGDVNGDGRAELVVLDHAKAKLRWYAWDPATKAMRRLTDLGFSGSYVCPFLCLPDIDRDSTVVEFLGSTLSFTKPFVVAVLASPPYWAGQDGDGNEIQYKGNSYTRYGLTAGATAGASGTIGYSAGASVGAKVTVPVLANGEAEAKVTASCSWDFSIGVEQSYSATIAYDDYAGEDSVVFLAIPLDVYAYRVASADATRAGAPAAGSVLTISVPRKAACHFVSTEFYNANNGDAPDIDATVLAHTIGQPRSYPTKAALLAEAGLGLPDRFFASTLAGTVPQGERYVLVSYSSATTVGAEYSYAAELSSEFEISFGLLAGGQQSFRYGYSLSLSATTGTCMDGYVGGLQTAYYTDPTYQYTWGLASMYKLLSNGNPFTLVTYWVE